MAAATAESDVQIDQDLYSRQIYVLGVETMKKMAQATVLLHGLDGLGIEIAKNIALAGVKSLTVADEKGLEWADLSGQFYGLPSDIGRNRAELSAVRLAELNPYVPVKHLTKPASAIDTALLADYQCVVLANAPEAEARRINALCHQKGVRFILAEARGAFCRVFVDLGVGFEVGDKNGEEAEESMISSVTRDAKGVVTTAATKRHGLESGDWVKFSEVEGMTELNGQTFKIEVINPFSFSIGDTSKFGAYTAGGLATEQKVPTKTDFLPFEEAINRSEISICDFAKMGNPAQCHVTFLALHSFAQAHNGQLPRIWHADDAKQLIETAKELNKAFPAGSQAKLEEIDENLARQLSFTARGTLTGLTAFLGGFVGQEVLKALSGKFSPLKQWLYLDAVELLPPIDTDPAQFQTKNDRYDGQRIVLGQQTCDKLSDLRTFVVGSGAIGCEMLKNFALMGVATSAKGLLTVTDNDLIEKSNLNRQFLFRSKDIGHPKSQCAARAVQAMNADIKIEPQTHKVCEASEKLYTNAWWQSQDLFVNALDNIEARLYVDGRCLRNRKPLVESGTMSTKGHVQVIVPGKSANYGATRDPPEAGIPFCTLKSFPSNIEHTIQWARDKFNTLFSLRVSEGNQILDDANTEEIKSFIEKVRAKSNKKKDLSHAVKLLSNRPKTFEDCVALARQKFESFFHNNIVQLLFLLPLDKKNEDGTLFWALPRRPPKALVFDVHTPEHIDFIYHCTHLFANIYNVPNRVTDRPAFAKLAEAVKLAKFEIKKDKYVETNEQASKDQSHHAQAQAAPVVDLTPEDRDALLVQLEKAIHSNMPTRGKPEDFEKDDDSNHHIDFIQAASNLRALQYGIQPAERLKTKKVAGKIIPAMATSTSAITGLAALEIIKIILHLPLQLYKNAWMNLALPSLTFSEPQEAKKFRINDQVSFSLWDRWEVHQGDLALGQFLNYFKKTYKVVVQAIIKNTDMVYNNLQADYKKKVPFKMSKVLGVDPATTESVELTVAFETLEGKDIDTVPPVTLFFKKRASATD